MTVGASEGSGPPHMMYALTHNNWKSRGEIVEKRTSHAGLALLVGVTMLPLAGCGGGSASSSSASSSSITYTVGGEVSGLDANESITLLNNGGDALMVTGDGGFTFSTNQAAGSTYAVTVRSHTPGVVCPVSNGSGTIGSSNVTRVTVSCAVGAESVLYSFMGSLSDGMTPMGQLVMDSAGNLYGTTRGGDSSNGGTVFKISAAGMVSILHFFTGGTTDGAAPQASLITDGAGNLYGTTSGGGPNNLGTVFKISASGAESIVYSFAGSPNDGALPNALVMDSTGNLYGTTSAGGANYDGTMFKIDPVGTETVLHSFGASQTDGVGPNSLITDGAGNFYGTTLQGGRGGWGTVFKITSAGSESALYSFGSRVDDGMAPQSLIMDNAGDLYGVTWEGGPNSNGTVFKISVSGTESELYSFLGGSIDGTAPTSLVIDSSGNLYGTANAGPSQAGVVFKINAAGAESLLYSFKNGTSDGILPDTLIMDGDGNLYGATSSGGYYDDGTVFKID